jgi:hypothetical protein
MTTPPRQYEVERELRERIKAALDARGITTAPAAFALTGGGWAAAVPDSGQAAAVPGSGRAAAAPGSARAADRRVARDEQAGSADCPPDRPDDPSADHSLGTR